jgi:hypothetical protein
VRFADPCATDVNSSSIRFADTCAAEAGSVNVRLADTCATEVNAPFVPLADAHAGEVNTSHPIQSGCSGTSRSVADSPSGAQYRITGSRPHRRERLIAEVGLAPTMRERGCGTLYIYIVT